MGKRSLYLLLLIVNLFSPGVIAGTHFSPDNKVDSVQFLTTADGPYLFHLPDGGIRIVSVAPGGLVTDTVFSSIPSGFYMPVVSNAGKFLFSVPLHPIVRPKWKQSQPEKLFVMSDPHGNWECFSELLKSHKVINERYEWTYGNNHLMINGDIFDRGDDVLTIFWLVYKLEAEAEAAGGKVSFLLGNHEGMVLGDDLRYINDKYKILSEQLNIPYGEFFGVDTELGRWLATRNTIQKIGDILFVHAGLSSEMLTYPLSVPEINQTVSSALFMPSSERKQEGGDITFLYGSNGPLWYRGMVSQEERYNPLPADTLDLIMQKYETDQIIVGHTIFPDITTFYDGHVIDVNVNNAKNRENGLGRGILIDKEGIWIIYDDNQKKMPLK